MATSIRITLFLIINVAIYVSQSEAITRKESNYKASAPKSPSPSNYSAVEDYCKAYKLRDKCGREVVGVILDRNKDASTVGGDCCRELLGMWRECYEALLVNLAEDYKDHDKKYITIKGQNIWLHCVSSYDG